MCNQSCWYLPTWHCVCHKCNRMSTGSRLRRYARHRRLTSPQLYHQDSILYRFLSSGVHAGSHEIHALIYAHFNTCVSIAQHYRNSMILKM